jgi:hypothetical protein
MHAPLDTLSPTFTNSKSKGQAWWAESMNFAGISWWHVKQVEQGSMGHDSKHEASSGRTNNAKKGVDESIWAMQLVEHAGKKVAEEK